jgi:hypothetical protein
MFGERDPTGRHVFECALYGWILCRRAIFGLGLSVDTYPPAVTYKANAARMSPFQ